MPDLTLYYTLGSCAFVPLVALEEAGEPFVVKFVILAKGDHKTAAFLALNPVGKVPVLVVDGWALAETVAILSWLAGRFPSARLLPEPGDLRGRAAILADLAYVASTLHPLVPRIRVPHRICDTDPARVRALAIEAVRPQFALIDKRVANGWWYGDTWSVMDAYVYWVWSRIRDAEVDLSAYPNYARHAADSEARPAVQRALARQPTAGG